MVDIAAADLANAVTAFATILGGLIPLLLTAMTRPQPLRWVLVYWGMLVTGIATVWFHGYGEGYLSGLADGGTNLLLAWLIQVAVLFDAYRPGFRLPIVIISAVLNSAVIIWRALYGPGFTSLYIVSFGSFGGFHPMELMLIIDCIAIVALFFGSIGKIPQRTRPLLYLLTCMFSIGALLATASNQRVDFHIICYHALWHIVGAFGFIVLWAFNRERFG